MSHELVLLTGEGNFTVAISDSDDKLKDIETFIDTVIKTMIIVIDSMHSDAFETADFDAIGCICGVQDHTYELIPLTNENRMDFLGWMFVINSEMFADKTEELFGVRLEFVSQTNCDRVGAELPVEWRTTFIRPSKVAII